MGGPGTHEQTSRRRARPSGRLVFVGGLAVFLGLYNNVMSWVPGWDRWYVPANLVAAFGVAALARGLGLSWADLGLGGRQVRDGLLWGFAAAAVVVAVLAATVAVPALRSFLDDARYADAGAGTLAYHALVRIPLGTVLWEELAFRGVLFGAWASVQGPRAAALGSSAVFGIWHVRPSLGMLDANGATSAILVVAGVGGAVIATFVAGLLFCFLRARSGSLLASIMAHLATNSLGIAAIATARSLG